MEPSQKASDYTGAPAQAADGQSNATTRRAQRSPKQLRIRKQIGENRELALAEISDGSDTFYNESQPQSRLGGVSTEKLEAISGRRTQRECNFFAGHRAGDTTGHQEKEWI
jgi:hypothetical protein